MIVAIRVTEPSDISGDCQQTRSDISGDLCRAQETFDVLEPDLIARLRSSDIWGGYRPFGRNTIFSSPTYSDILGGRPSLGPDISGDKGEKVRTTWAVSTSISSDISGNVKPSRSISGHFDSDISGEMAQKVRTSQAESSSRGRVYRIWFAVLMMIIICIYSLKRSTSKSIKRCVGMFSTFSENAELTSQNCLFPPTN